MPNELLLLVGENLLIPDLYNFLSTCHRLSNIFTPRLHNLVVQDEGGMGTLKWAVKHGHGPLAELALLLGADTNMRYDREERLYMRTAEIHLIGPPFMSIPISFPSCSSRVQNLMTHLVE